MPEVTKKGVVKLSAEDKVKLISLEGDIEKADRAIALMKEMDMDTAKIEDTINWAKKARTILLKEFV